MKRPIPKSSTNSLTRYSGASIKPPALISGETAINKVRSSAAQSVMHLADRSVMQPAVLPAVERVRQRAVPLQAVPVEKGVRKSAADSNGGMR